MSWKLPFGLTYREFDAERDKHGVFFIWLIGYFALAVSAVILVTAAIHHFDWETLRIGLVMFWGSFVILRFAYGTRQKIKAHDADLAE